MAGQIGLIFSCDLGFKGLNAIIAAALISTPIAIILGIFSGIILNRAKGHEMIASYILGFFMNGIYQLIVLYLIGWLIPVHNKALLLSRGYGVRNSISLSGIRSALDNFIPAVITGSEGAKNFSMLNSGNIFLLIQLPFFDGVIKIPLGTIILIIISCLIMRWFQNTKLAHDMKAIAQNQTAAYSAGIPVNRTRITAVVISTVLACYGQIIYLQNIGTLNTYSGHDQAALFSIAALLIGGASISRAGIKNLFAGVILFHLIFITAPNAGKNLIGDAQTGEYFRVFISYLIIALSLVIHSRRRHID